MGLQALIEKGKSYEAITNQLSALATGYDYDQPIFIPESEPWTLPAGAYGENCGAP